MAAGPAAAAEAGPAPLLSWLFMGLVSLPTLVSIAGMSSRYPGSGGIAAYASGVMIFSVHETEAAADFQHTK